MIEFLAENIATVIVLALFAGCVAAIIVFLAVRRKRHPKNCNGDCTQCLSGDKCRQ